MYVVHTQDLSTSPKQQIELKVIHFQLFVRVCVCYDQSKENWG